VYRWVEHTGELELEIEAASEQEVFEDAMKAIGELLGAVGGEPSPPTVLALGAEDRAVLLADWIGELAFLAETEGLLPRRLTSIELGPAGLRAEIEGTYGRPPNLVKAATYHRLAFERAGAGWRATVVLDV
jgi:SHS2 domain-containing protein